MPSLRHTCQWSCGRVPGAGGLTRWDERLCQPETPTHISTCHPAKRPSLFLYCPWTDRFLCWAQKLCRELFPDLANAPLYDKECRQTLNLFPAWRTEIVGDLNLWLGWSLRFALQCSLHAPFLGLFRPQSASWCMMQCTAHSRCSIGCKSNKFVPGQFHVGYALTYVLKKCLFPSLYRAWI